MLGAAGMTVAQFKREGWDVVHAFADNKLPPDSGCQRLVTNLTLAQERLEIMCVHPDARLHSC